MTQANLLKNAVLRNKMETNVSNPAGDIASEIAEQDLNNQVGGAIYNTTVIGPQLPITVVTRSFICNTNTIGVVCNWQL